jgi:hypothetical protein
MPPPKHASRKNSASGSTNEHYNSAAPAQATSRPSSTSQHKKKSTRSTPAIVLPQRSSSQEDVHTQLTGVRFASPPPRATSPTPTLPAGVNGSRFGYSSAASAAAGYENDALHPTAQIEPRSVSSKQRQDIAILGGVTFSLLVVGGAAKYRHKIKKSLGNLSCNEGDEKEESPAR